MSLFCRELTDAQKQFKSERASLQSVPYTRSILNHANFLPRKSTDAAVLESISKVPSLSKYLGASFGLSHGDKPHLMKF